MPLTAEQIIQRLRLEPLPGEGGFYRETYRAADTIPADALPSRYQSTSPRHHSTQIYFLMTPDTPSLMHAVQSDEVFHHYTGDPVEQLRIEADGSAEIVRIGPDLAADQQPQAVVPQGVWQGCRIVPDLTTHGYALLGCTVSPGFDWDDFRLGSRAEMRALVRDTDPRVLELIDALTTAEPASDT